MSIQTTTTSELDALAATGPRGHVSAAHARLFALSHSVLSGAVFTVSALLAAWARIIADVDPARAMNMQRTHAIAALLAALPLGAALVANGALDDRREDRPLMFRSARVAALGLHGASVALMIVAAHFGATSYGAEMATAYSARQSSSSVLWLLAALAAATASAALSSILTIIALHGGRRSAWTSADPARWAAFVSSFVSAFAAPIALLWVGFAAMERTVGVGVFDPSLGGHPLRFQLLRSLWMQPMMVSWLILGLGVIERGLWLRAGEPAVRSRWPLVALALLSPFGLSPIEHAWHESSIVIAQASLLSLLFYAPFVTIARRWIALLARGDGEDKTLVAASLGALGGLAIAVPAGVLMALANVGPALALTPFASAARHALLIAVGAAAAVLSFVRWGTSEREPAVVSASWVIAAGVLLAFVPPLVAGARGLPVMPPAFAWASTLGVVSTVLATLVVIAFSARVRGTRVDRDHSAPQRG